MQLASAENVQHTLQIVAGDRNPATCSLKAFPGSPGKSRVVFAGDSAGSNLRLWSDDGLLGSDAGAHAMGST
jgi:hypothetical protein